MTAIASAVFFMALAVIPMLIALVRGERVRYLSQFRDRGVSASAVSWTARTGREYVLVLDIGRLLVVAA